MNLIKSLRLDRATSETPIISFVGAGGKTSAIFKLAREMRSDSYHSVLVSATTHLGSWQTSLADHHVIAKDIDDLDNLPENGIILITGEIENERTNPIDKTILAWLHEYTIARNIPFLIEADGARQKPLKAPALHEPPIPEFTQIVIVVAGLQAIGKPLTEEYIHRDASFSLLSGIRTNQPITADALVRVLSDPLGGFKNIPIHARSVAFLNQADTPELQSIGGSMARELIDEYNSVIVGSLENNQYQTFERCAGIILAAGESTRFGSAKQLLEWKGKPFVRQVAETALHSGLQPVTVITGFQASAVESALDGLQVKIVHNPDFRQGQSTSIRAGLQKIELNIGAAIFLLADQPQIPEDIIHALVDSHSKNLQPILAPLVHEERRANPVLFDRVAFPDLLNLTGDVGGRAIFDKHPVDYLPWHDDILLFDVDRPEDYERLKGME